MSFIDAFFHKNRTATALSLILAAAVAVGAPAARAADAAAATAAPTPGTAQTPFTYKILRAQTVVQPDGTSETLEHYEIQVNNDEAARTFHSFPIAFDASREETELVEAYTIKKDGRKIPVDPAGVFVQMPQGGADTPMFDNMRQRMVVYPDLAAGDTIVYIGKRRETKPLMDGQYFRSAYYDRHQSFEDVRVEISLPRDKPLYVETRGVTATQADQGDRIVHTLTYSAPQALLDDNSAVSGFDRLPGYLVSTVPDYTALVRQYAGMIAAPAAPTATVRAKAEEITRGIRDRRAQAAALHAWVAAHIRYIGIEIGEGGLVPHPVDTILANGYGDCKDHAALYAALLKAKGIDADFVLINAGNAYKTAEHGSLTPFNHAITYIPEFGLYDDTTAATAPFGVLPIQEYGKPVVHVALDGGLPKGDVLRHTPLLPPGAASSDTRVTATLTADGAISGQGTATATGAFSIGLRAIGQGIAANGPQRFAEDYLKRINLTGGMTLDADPPADFSKPDRYSIRQTFHFDARPEQVDGVSFTLPVGFRALRQPGDVLMGYLGNIKLKDSEPTPCYSGHQVEDLSLTIPAGTHVVRLPDSATIETPNLRYASTWNQTGQVVTHRTEFTSTIDTALCQGEVRQETAKALKKILADHRKDIAVVAD